MSNVIEIAPATLNDSLTNVVDISTTYSFVTMSQASEFSKITDINFGVSYYEAAVENVEIHHYFIIEYNEDVVTYISENAYDDNGDIRHMTNYANDLIFKFAPLGA